MSRKTSLWKKKLRQANGDFDKINPSHAVGTGTYLVQKDIPDRMYAPKEGESKKVCSLPMSAAKEQRIRGLAARFR